MCRLEPALGSCPTSTVLHSLGCGAGRPQCHGTRCRLCCSCASPRPALLSLSPHAGLQASLSLHTPGCRQVSLSTLRAAGKSVRPQRHGRHGTSSSLRRPATVRGERLSQPVGQASAAVKTRHCAPPTVTGLADCLRHDSRPPAGAGTCAPPRATQACHDSDDWDSAYFPQDWDTGSPSRRGSRCMACKYARPRHSGCPRLAWHGFGSESLMIK